MSKYDEIIEKCNKEFCGTARAILRGCKDRIILESIYDTGMNEIDSAKNKIDDLQKELKLTQDEMYELDSDLFNITKLLYGEDATVSASEIVEEINKLKNKNRKLQEVLTGLE